MVDHKKRPIGGAVYPAILGETAFRSLNSCQPDQSAQRCACLTSGQKRSCALHEISGPDEMITAKIVIALGFTPGDTHRCDERALKNFIFMRQQHTTA